MQVAQKGIIGITLVSNWIVPFSDARHNHDAALRALDFMFGWLSILKLHDSLLWLSLKFVLDIYIFLFACYLQRIEKKLFVIKKNPSLVFISINILVDKTKRTFN